MSKFQENGKKCIERVAVFLLIKNYSLKNFYGLFLIEEKFDTIKA